MSLLCRWGLHWRMKIVEAIFTDIVSGKLVYEATCPCGRSWMIDSTHGFPAFKVEMTKSKSK
jgi:hypothetical protein